jgi:GTPase
MKRLTIAIVGRPNVGKSTLFNRLFGRRRALVHDMPGVTRDRLVEELDWLVKGQMIPVRLIDTGGLGGDRFADEIREQVTIALSEADVAICLFDAQAGLLPADEELVRELQRSMSKAKRVIPMIAVVNKVDAEVHEGLIADFVGLGLDPVLTVSAEHGRGMDDLKEEILRQAPVETENQTDETEDGTQTATATATETDSETETETETETESVPVNRPRSGPPRIAIVGRPNVEKYSGQRSAR